jgi:hypothetical protein
MAPRIGVHTKALDQLYELMRDPAVGMRVRIMAAISASRVEPTELPGGEPPPAVAFLRNIMTMRHAGQPYSAAWRSKAGAALSYYERRTAIVALKFQVEDDSERRASWRRLINGLLRRELWAQGRWPQDKAALLGAEEQIEFPACSPETALTALLLPAEGRAQRRRKKALDEPAAPTIADEGERREILRSIALLMQRRLEALPDKEAGYQ